MKLKHRIEAWQDRRKALKNVKLDPLAFEPVHHEKAKKKDLVVDGKGVVEHDVPEEEWKNAQPWYPRKRSRR